MVAEPERQSNHEVAARRRHADRGDSPAPAGATGARCPVCREVVVGDRSVVFRSDQRVAHVRCVSPICPGCGEPLAADDRVLRDGADLFHLACLFAHRRRRIRGGAASDPWTAIFHDRLASRAARDHAVLEELRAVLREVHGQCRTLQAWARCVRGGRSRAAA